MPGAEIYRGSWKMNELKEFTDICHAKQRESEIPTSVDSTYLPKINA
jgi:hypothetical protein